MAMNTALRRLLPLLLLILPPPLRHYLSAPPSDHGGATEQLQVYHPIILFPGFSCSNLEVRLTDAYTPSVPRCGVLKGKGWFPLWKNPWDLLRHDYVPCFEEQMTLVFDPALNDYRNLPGVETRVPDFGSAYGFISKNDAHNMSCMIRLREQLEALGYHDKDTLFGAPYDIRHAPPPSGQPSQVYSDYFDRVKDLVQHASEKNGNKPVILVGHSFGARVILDFLNSTSVPWRQKLIKHIVVISPTPSTGFTLVATNLASGPDVIIGVPTVSPLALRPMWRSFTSPFLSLPSPTIFGHKPLVITKNKNYSAYDYPHFLAALGFGTDGVVAFMKRMLPTMLRVDAPMVPTTYLNGAGIQTTEQVVYWEGNFDIAPEIVHGDGDGCINMVSVLAFVKELHRQQRRNNIPFKFVKINHATHSDILSREHSLRVIMTELLEANC